MPTTVMIVDDHPVFRKGLSLLLQEESEVMLVGEAADGLAGLTLVEQMKPDVVVMDISMPKLDGIEATKRMKSVSPNTKVLAFSIHAGMRFVRGMLQAGADGYILKENASEEVVRAIKKVSRGEHFLSPEITEALVSQLRNGAPSKIESCRRESVPAVILRTKLNRAGSPPDAVLRTDLLKRLSKNRHRVLTLISAPAGYGKSVLASTWLDSLDCPNAWLSLDERESELRLFLESFIAAIKTMFPDADLSIAALLEAATLPPVAVMSRHLLNDLDRIGGDFVLALDDYHLVHNMAVHDLLSTLLKYPPKGFHLVLLTRSDPPLPLSTLRAKGQLHEISMKQLRFNTLETVTFLNQTTGMALDEKTSEQVNEKIEGWAVGLRLVSLTMKEEADVSRILSHLKGDFSKVAEYLVAEVVSLQSPAMMSCLLNTSILNRFCVALCDELLDADGLSDGAPADGRSFLAYLQANNLFLVSLDVEKLWFRYHHMFQLLLQQQLVLRKDDVYIARLHSRAGQWFAEHGDVDEAIHHALAAKDLEFAAQIVEKHRIDILDDDKWYVLAGWLDRLPGEIISLRPALLLARAWVLFHQFKIPKIPPVLDALEKVLTDDPSDESLFGELHFFRGFICFIQGQISEAITHHEQSLRYMPKTSDHLRGEADLHYGLTLQARGEGALAVQHLKDRLCSRQTVDSYSSRILAGLIFVYFLEGDLQEALPATNHFRKMGIELQSRFVEAYGAYLQASGYLVTNNLDAALSHFEVLFEHRYLAPAKPAIDGMWGLALTYQLLQQPDKATDTLVRLREFAAESENSTHKAFAASCQARMSLLQGDLASAVHWLESGADLTTDVGAMLFWLEVPRLTQCRVWIAAGTSESLGQANKKLQEYLKTNRAVHNTRRVIDILLLQSLLYKKQGDPGLALATLTEAVLLAHPGGFVLSFVEMGADLRDMLGDLSIDEVPSNYRETLLAAFSGVVGHQNALPGRGSPKEETEPNIGKVSSAPTAAVPEEEVERLIEPLTMREKEILDFLVAGMRNKEIGAKLFVSSETIKKHLYNIYRKLGVHNRLSAIKKVDKLGLLRRN